MSESRKVETLSREMFFKIHLSLLNVMLSIRLEPMTPKEVEVLSTFMALEGDIAVYRFGSSARKIIRTKLNMSESGLSNHMRELLRKGYIKDTENGVIIHSKLHTEANEHVYWFKLINDAKTY